MATDYVAAVAKMRALVGVYLAALAKGPLTAHQAASLETDLKTLDKDLAALAAQEAPKVASTEPSGYFVTGASDDVLIKGGSPDNPDGVTFTYADAVKWWQDVFAKGLNISKVRSALTPGSKVLTPEGLAAARKLGVDSTNFAPEDYNPLGLDIVP